MLGIIEIKGETPKQSILKKTIIHKGGFFYIKFKIENEEDSDLLMDIFWVHFSYWFNGLSIEPNIGDTKATLNKEQTIYYDYQANTINII